MAINVKGSNVIPQSSASLCGRLSGGSHRRWRAATYTCRGHIATGTMLHQVWERARFRVAGIVAVSTEAIRRLIEKELRAVPASDKLWFPRLWLLHSGEIRTMSRTLAIALAASAVLAAPATAEVRLERAFPAASASTLTKTEAPALVFGGTFVILATVNGASQAALRVDSGATDVMLPRTVAARLIRAGSLTHADYVTTKTYRLADGSLRTQKVYRLRSLQVGTFIVRDIPCTISNDDTGLLGQSFLSKAQDWAMDNRRHVLTLTY